MRHAGGSRTFCSDGTDKNSNGNSSSSDSSGNPGWYDLLQLPRDAPVETIKRTYRQLALLWHPDKGGSVTRFQSLTAAWEVLGNAERRRWYDRQLVRSGSTDGMQFTRRNSWAGTSAGSAAAAATGEATAAETAAAAHVKTSADRISLRTRRHTATGVTPVCMQQQQKQDKQQQQQRTDSFRAWAKVPSFVSEEAVASSHEKAPQVAAAKAWSREETDSSRSAGCKDTSTANVQPPSTSEAAASFGRTRDAVERGKLHSARQLYSQQQQQQQQQEHEQQRGAATGSRPFERKGSLLFGKPQKQTTTGGAEGVYHSPDKFGTRLSSLYAGGVSARADAASSAAGGGGSSVNCQTSWRGFPCSSSFAAATATGTVDSIPPYRTAAAAAADREAGNKFRQWTSGSGSTDSLAKIEFGLKEVLGEEGIQRRRTSSSNSLPEEVQRLGVKQLKQLLSVLSIPHNFCIEKHDLLEAFAQAFPDVVLTASRSKNSACRTEEEASYTNGSDSGTIRIDSHNTDKEQGSDSGDRNAEDGFDSGIDASDRSESKSSPCSSDSDVFQKLNFSAPGASADACKGTAQENQEGSGSVDFSDRSDSKSSQSSSDSGVFHRFHSPAADARGAFASASRDVHAVAAAAARRRYLKRRQLLGLDASSSAAASVANALLAAISSSAATAAPSFASPEHLRCSSDYSFPSSEEKRQTPSPRRASSEATCQNTLAAAAALPQNELRIKLITLGGNKTGKSCIIKRYCEGRFVARNAATVALDYGVKVVKVKQQQSKQQQAENKKKQDIQHHYGGQQQSHEEKQQHGDGRQQQEETSVPVRVNFFDFSGKREFKEVRKEFYPHTDGVLLVYDVSRRESFLQLKDWLEEAPYLLQQRHSVHQQQTRKQKTLITRTEAFGSGEPHTPVVMLLGNKVDLEREVQTAEGENFAKDHGMLFSETSASSGHNIVNALETLFEAAAARIIFFRNMLEARLHDFKETPASTTNSAAAAPTLASNEPHPPALQCSSL